MGRKRIIQLPGTTTIISSDYLGIDSNADGARKISFEDFQTAVLGGMDLSKISDDIAPQYDSSVTYSAGDIVIYEDVLYICNGTTTGTWNSAKWDATSVAELLENIDLSADAISYDNATSGLTATDVQGAIDEVLETAGKVDDIVSHGQSLVENKISDLSSLSAVGTASGDIASFSDGSDLPMPNLKVAIEPVQDLHGYDAPWVGGAGKNKFDADSIQNGYINDNGELVARTYQACSPYISITASQAYTASAKTQFNNFGFAFFDSSKNIILPRYDNNNMQSATKTAPSNASYMRVWVDYNSSTTLNSDKVKELQVQVEQGNQPTSYAPYSNICPISGWSECNVSVSGVNIWDEEWEIGNIDNGTGLPVSSSSIIRAKNYINVVPNTTYFCKYLAGEGNTTVFYYDINKNFISLVYVKNMEITTPNNCKYIRFKIASSYGTTYNYDISINYPSTDTSYHAYNGHTYTIDLDGTRYGGTLDVVSGVLTVDRIKTSMPANWTVNTESSTYWLITNTRSDAISVENTDTSIRVISDGFKGVSANEMLTKMTTADNINSIALISSKRLFLKVAKADYPTLQDLYSMIQTNNIQVVYELATPQTIQLTPTQVKSLLGSNNVWADTGDILDAEYVRDATTIINEILSRLNA